MELAVHNYADQQSHRQEFRSLFFMYVYIHISLFLLVFYTNADTRAQTLLSSIMGIDSYAN